MRRLILVAVAIAAPHSLGAQVDTTGRISGRTSSALNGRPFPGVTISISATKKSVVSDSAGAFWLGGLPTGHPKIRLSYGGHQTREYVLTLQPGQTKRLAILVDSSAEDLDPVVAEVQHPNNWRDLAGFYERLRRYGGFAHFFTREEIDKTRPATISALLADEGIVMRCVQGCLPTRFIQGDACIVPVSVDGMPFREVDYDHISIDDVAGVEVYRGAAPSGLTYGSAVTGESPVWRSGPFRLAGACGSVLIWTR